MSDEDGPILEEGVERLYRHRFPREMLERRRAVWRAICKVWFARYVPADASVLEVAAGYCEFINNIPARRKAAVDLNPETKSHAASDVEVKLVAAENLTEAFPEERFDRIFMSNFLEHCRSRDQVLAVLQGCRDALAEDGKILIMGPNFRYCAADYFDFFDHHLPLTDQSVVEAMSMAGLEAEQVIPRTLPFSFKSRLPSWPWLVGAYLKMPLFWPLFGKQFFVVGRKR